MCDVKNVMCWDVEGEGGGQEEWGLYCFLNMKFYYCGRVHK